MNLLNSSQRNYRFHAVSRRSKFTAAAAYENHAAWRRSAAADNTAVFGKKYQVVVDYFSKWIEVRELSRNPTSDQLISHFKSIFSRFGIPDIAFSDREPIYALASMRKFCEQYDIKKDLSSARYSQSNGQVERAIGHVKNIIKRCSGKIDDINMCLLDYRRPHFMMDGARAEF